MLDRIITNDPWQENDQQAKQKHCCSAKLFPGLDEYCCEKQDRCELEEHAARKTGQSECAAGAYHPRQTILLICPHPQVDGEKQEEHEQILGHKQAGKEYL